ncbi:MAG TPA: Uma2 family endonuclease, partial [Isosphaeraceae bacterium]|nr:Uma2 family endonuclease [Isosphaeraceae bacterium]
MSRSAEARPVRDRQEPPAPNAPSTRKVFNRSSFEGDFLVSVPDQTAKDFEKYAPESQFCEYVEGTIYMPSPVSDRHQEWILFLVDMFNGFKWLRGGLGQILMGPAVLRLSPERLLEPDIFIRDPEPNPENPPARFVLEVLSPSNRTYDLEWKSAFYQEALIPEIWYVDGKELALVIDRRTGDSYERIRLSSGILISEVLAGFWIDVSWLWAQPLPNPRECLDRILAGP